MSSGEQGLFSQANFRRQRLMLRSRYVPNAGSVRTARLVHWSRAGGKRPAHLRNLGLWRWLSAVLSPS